MKKVVLTIAGSDPSGGAGIQADIKTITLNGAFAMSVITALTAQNTLGVVDIFNISENFFETQLVAIFEDIPPDAIKIGMLPNEKIIAIIEKTLKKYKARNIVLDPVMVSTSGRKFLSENAIKEMAQRLFPIVDIITPNIKETEILSSVNIKNKKDMENAAYLLEKKYSCSVLCKGGHFSENPDDVLCNNGRINWFLGERIDNKNNHGTGCTLSSAIATNLAKGKSLEEAILHSKIYINNCLSEKFDIGKGNGPLDHAYFIK